MKIYKIKKKNLTFWYFFLFRFPGYEMWTPICYFLAVIVLSTMYIFVWLCNFGMKIYKMGHCVNKEKRNNLTFWYFFSFSGFLGTKCGLPYAFYWPWSFCPRWQIRVDIVQTWQVDTQIKICRCQRCWTIWMSSVHCAQVEPNIFPESCR